MYIIIYLQLAPIYVLLQWSVRESRSLSHSITMMAPFVSGNQFQDYHIFHLFGNLPSVRHVVIVARFRLLAEQNRYNYVTPTSFRELILTFKELMAKKREEVSKAKRRYEVGLEKLAFASSQVAEMEKNLKELQPKLMETTREAVKMAEHTVKGRCYNRRFCE